MAITMQGAWTITVKAKNAAFAQRFVVSGASFNNGPHPGTPGTTIFVSGSQWSINIQSQAPGQPWKDSAQRLSFPAVSGGQVKFDIRSDDTGADKDYNDLVLTCSMPVSASEFVVYGNVKTYSGRCFFNPCHPWYVIDKFSSLKSALEIPDLRKVIEKVYPERVPKKPGPIPDPPPDFIPMVIPTGAPIENSGFLFRSARAGLSKAEIESGREEKDFLDTAVSRLKGTAVTATLNGAPGEAGLSLLEKQDIVAMARLSDWQRLYFPCSVERAPGVLLKFQEYDRTASERVGGVYTGAGARQDLGLAATDELGNYIFRFSQSLSDIVEESSDVGPGETLAAQVFPDVIVQALGTGMSVAYETAPYYNIPNLIRIDLCLPREHVHPSQGCGAFDRVIFKIGDIITLHSAITGTPNVLDGDGHITCRNANAPQVDCAAWRGTLRLYGCLTHTAPGEPIPNPNPNVERYTVRYRRIGIDSTWQFVTEPFKLNHIPDFAPGYNGTLVGPFVHSVKVDGFAPVLCSTYVNHQNDTNWIENDLKLILSSGIYRPADNPGSVEFRIQGYDSTGNLVAGADDTIPLYIDNRPAVAEIVSITMGATTLSDCALFSLTSPNAPLTVRYRVVDPEGFLQSWGLSVTRGNNVSLPVSVVGGVVPKSYVPPGSPACSLRGTLDEPTVDVQNCVETVLQPSAGANWLPPGQNFCAFAFTLSGNDRVTDGRNSYPPIAPWLDVIGLSFGP